MRNVNKYERSMGRGSVVSTATRGSHSKRSILHRTMFLMAWCGILMFVPLCWKLWDIAIVHHEEYQKIAAQQQAKDYTITAKRGDIYDRNGSLMAMSATVYKLILSPRDLVKSVSNKDENGKKLSDEVYQANVAAA